jgi:hypothetical protein
MPIPVIGRIEAGRVILDLRCLEDEAAFTAQFILKKRGASFETAASQLPQDEAFS